MGYHAFMIVFKIFEIKPSLVQTRIDFEHETQIFEKKNTSLIKKKKTK